MPGCDRGLKDVETNLDFDFKSVSKVAISLTNFLSLTQKKSQEMFAVLVSELFNSSNLTRKERSRFV